MNKKSGADLSSAPVSEIFDYDIDNQCVKEELKNMLDSFRKVFLPFVRDESVVVYNPHFGIGSRIIGGADADIYNDTVNGTVKIDLTKREREIYLLIKSNEYISIDKMVKISGVSRATVNRAIKGLKAKNYISRDGSDKNGKWIVLE